jgi:hypothetical protein
VTATDYDGGGLAAADDDVGQLTRPMEKSIAASPAAGEETGLRLTTMALGKFSISQPDGDPVIAGAKNAAVV